MTRAEPPASLTDAKAILLAQLRYYRASVLAKLEGLEEGHLTSSILPSGWSPLGLLKHLVHVERRWMHWGFAGEPVDQPWADHEPGTERWRLETADTLPALTEALGQAQARTEALAAPAALTDLARTGGRFASDPPTLGWILIHLLQEYARHVGQLDVVRELLDGQTGE